MEITSEALTTFFRVVLPLLNERQRRLVAAATGFSRNTLIGGAKEFEGGAEPSERVRRPGGWGRPWTQAPPGSPGPPAARG